MNAPARRRARAAREEGILRAALGVFASAGYAGASMEAIAEAAGITKPTLYQYVGSKEALFARLMGEGRDIMLAPFEGPDPGGSTVARLHAFAWAYADFVLRPEYLSLARLVIGEAQRFPGIGRVYQAAGPDRLLQGIIRFLETRRDAGDLVFDEADLAAHDLWALILSAPRTRALHEPEAPPGRQEIRRHLENGLRVFLRAYAARPDAALAELRTLCSTPDRDTRQAEAP
ncbi:MAG: TetR/AcrR family transcriptional regulator [Rhodobacteraceae bacterium]|nr:TetR/AcrR family transcriptional regulator [Paracoccaceae bacterium]